MAEELLSQEWLRRAKRINPFYKTRLHWSLPSDWPNDVGSSEFANHVAAFQKEQGNLTVDGVLGPKTWEAIQGRSWIPPARDFLIIAGERINATFPVVTWLEPGGMSFLEKPSWKKRKDSTGKSINLFVLHWDGCTSSHQCYQVLLERNLSVHLMLDGDGTVYQSLDLAEARAWHAGDVNERSIGVEIQNPVKVERNKWQNPPRPVITEPHVYGRNGFTRLDFYDIQKQRVVELTNAICEHFHIPRKLPVNEAGEVIRGLAPSNFQGVCGHYHLTMKKPDPGLSLWPGLQTLFQTQTRSE